MIETYVLEHLAAVAKYGTFSKVAEELFTSQPAVTRSMKKIEDELGVKLFDRTKNKIALNELGLEAARYAQSILDLQHTMIESIRSMDKRSHTFSFASPAPAPIKELTSLISQTYTGMAISSELLHLTELLPLLDAKDIELAVTLGPPEGDKYFCVPFMREDLAVLIPRKHDLAKENKNGLYLKDLAGETFLLYSAVGFWHDIVQTLIPDVKFIIQNEYGTLGTLIDASTLPSFVTNVSLTWRAIPEDRVILPLHDECVHVTFYAVFRIEDRWRHEKLIASLETFCKECDERFGTIS